MSLWPRLTFMNLKIGVGVGGTSDLQTMASDEQKIVAEIIYERLVRLPNHRTIEKYTCTRCDYQKSDILYGRGVGVVGEVDSHDSGS